MKLVKCFLLALLGLCAATRSLAAQVVFNNNDGMFVSTGQTSGTLSLTGSTLVGIQGLSAFGISDNSVTPPASLGTLTLTTGAMVAGGNITSNASFGAGGMFSFTFSNGVVFSGSFTGASWTQIVPGTWSFVGTIMNGTLTVPGYLPATIGTAVTINLTAVGATHNCVTGGGCTFTDSGGLTSFSAPTLSPVPEPGTLTLLGSGLVGLGLFAKRFRVQR